MSTRGEVVKEMAGKLKYRHSPFYKWGLLLECESCSQSGEFKGCDSSTGIFEN
jgi:hypothetical protein